LAAFSRLRPSEVPRVATRRTFSFEANGTTPIERSTSGGRRSTFSCAVIATSRRHKRSFARRSPRISIDGRARRHWMCRHRALRLLRREDPKRRNVEVRTCKYLNNIVEQDHRAIKRRCASMAGFKSFGNAAITIAESSWRTAFIKGNSHLASADRVASGRGRCHGTGLA
jgi:transposase-like protein